MKIPTWYARVACALAAVAVAAIVISACSQSPANPNPRADVPLKPANVDLPRYMGRWYVIAIIPYFLESKYVGSYADWSLREDGKIDDRYTAHAKTFDALPSTFHFVDSVVPGSENGEWRVRIVWPVHVTQLTLYVDDDYRYTLLGLRDKSLGWIFAREPDVSEDVYRSLLARFDALGFDASRFRRVPQHPHQIGKPGFLPPGE
ncbi:lipocalin family protein [Paraburkholderia azotifigens]|uniref:Outer membrane lipoprotein Blc n=1 Tax=Paraburkholderia azotifigens TaxID=2057004 RepID=A0A5C6V8A4_9BURK|nr:lipocalin family protein [Paraburkholderia azotifigens]TXC80751.1 lipocalin family protein [Paraburkholderia azotifigens]